MIDLYSKTDANLYIKNQDLHSAPYFVGRAGPYTFDEQEWNIYKNELQGILSCVVCAHSTVMVDTDRFFEENPENLDSFNTLNMKIAHALFTANSLQRKRSDEFFSDLVHLNQPYTKDIFMFSKNYIRFWNYGWKSEKLDPETILSLLEETKKTINKFCISEETIYKSCGMPTRFRIAFSCVFSDFVNPTFSKRRFSVLALTGLNDLYSDEVKEILELKEKIFQLFNGGDVISFYQAGKLNPKDVVREISFILNTYKLPFFRWNFSKTTESDMSLSEFI